MEATCFVQSVLTRDDSAHTAHQVASRVDPAALPEAIANVLRRRASAIQARRDAFRAWRAAHANDAAQPGSARERDTFLSRDADDSLEL